MEGSVAQSSGPDSFSSLVTAPSGGGDLPWLAAVRWLYFSSEGALQEQSDSSSLRARRMQKQPNATPGKFVLTRVASERHDVVYPL